MSSISRLTLNEKNTATEKKNEYKRLIISSTQPRENIVIEKETSAKPCKEKTNNNCIVECHIWNSFMFIFVYCSFSCTKTMYNDWYKHNWYDLPDVIQNHRYIFINSKTIILI